MVQVLGHSGLLVLHGEGGSEGKQGVSCKPILPSCTMQTFPNSPDCLLAVLSQGLYPLCD